MSVVSGALRAALTYFEGVLGGDKYRNYLAFHERHHPGVAPMSEREYWRSRYAHEDAHPEGRCC